MSAEISLVHSHAPRSVRVDAPADFERITVEFGDITLYLTADSARSLAAQLERAANAMDSRVEAAA